MLQQANTTDVCADTVLTGLIGRGIGQSRSPAMHEAEGAANGLRYTYRLFDMDQPDMAGLSLADVLNRAEADGFAGLNITFPFKIDVIDHLHFLSDNARKVGAVNTVVFRDGKRYGHNTDLWGYAQGFRTGMTDVALDRVLLLGAGGAGVAVANALFDLGVKSLWIHDTNDARRDALVVALADLYGADRVSGTDSASLASLTVNGVVNATPVGMAKLPGSPFPKDLLRPDMWVSDIVYFPLETQLLADARAAGCRVLPGSGMAVYQAVRAFELFTGIAPDAARMKRVFESLGA